MDRRILLIGYWYPPCESVGSIRIEKFAKYLPDNWEVHVLTKSQENTDNHSEFQPNSAPRVHRVREPVSSVSKNLDHLRWSFPLAYNIKRLHTKYDFDCVWHTGNPFFPFVVAPLIKRISDISYIVDFRDSWTLHPYAELSGMFGNLNAFLSGVLEPKVLKSADAITTATDGITEEYRNAYPELDHKFYTIENGFDPDDFPDTNTAKETPSFTLVYVGKFSSFRDPRPIFNAISDLKSDVDMKFIHVGNTESKVEKYADSSEIGELYESTGYLQREGVTKCIRQADVGVAVSGGSNQEMTTKIFDYMACETPILACGPTDGAMSSVVQQFENGYIVPNDQELITEKLMRIINKKPKSLGPGPYDKYTRRHKAEELKTIIEDTI